MTQSHTNLRTAAPHLPGHPATGPRLLPKHRLQPRQGPPPVPRDPCPVGEVLGLGDRSLRPHCAEVETEADGARLGHPVVLASQGYVWVRDLALRIPGAKIRSLALAWSSHLEIRNLAVPAGPSSVALSATVPMLPKGKLSPRWPSSEFPGSPLWVSPAAATARPGFLELSGRQRPPIRVRGGARLLCIMPANRPKRPRAGSLGRSFCEIHQS